MTITEYDYNFLHASKRALERYKIKVRVQLYKEFIIAIQGKFQGKIIKVQMVKPLEEFKSLYKIRYKNRNMYTVYCNKTQKIITFLPDNPLELSEL